MKPSTGLLLGSMLLWLAASVGSAQESGGVKINATAGNIVNSATGGSTAVTRVGTATGGNAEINAHVSGTVTNTAAAGNTARTEIGVSTGNTRTSVNVGNVITDATRNDAGTYIGANTSSVGRAAGTNVDISGSVINKGGDIVVGGNGICQGYRDNKCCLEFHLRKCVVSMFAKPPKKPCPPGYNLSVGFCRLYADYNHSVSE